MLSIPNQQLLQFKNVQSLSMAAQRKSKTVAFKFGDFDFMTNNHVAAITDKDEVIGEFHPIMDFMMTGPLNHALTATSIINMDAVTQAWTSASGG